jgi:hypothetical protein
VHALVNQYSSVVINCLIFKEKRKRQNLHFLLFNVKTVTTMPTIPNTGITTAITIFKILLEGGGGGDGVGILSSNLKPETFPYFVLILWICLS